SSQPDLMTPCSPPSTARFPAYSSSRSYETRGPCQVAGQNSEQNRFLRFTSCGVTWPLFRRDAAMVEHCGTYLARKELVHSIFLQAQRRGRGDLASWLRHAALADDHGSSYRFG